MNDYGVYMQIAIIGLGRMGANILRRLARQGHQCIGYDAHCNQSELAGDNITLVNSLEKAVQAFENNTRRVIWLMLPAGKITEDTIEALSNFKTSPLRPHDIIIDGGNTYYKDDISRAKKLKQIGVDYIDVGTSGGVWGLERGYCLMIGGKKDAVEYLDPIFKVLAPGKGNIEITKGRDVSQASLDSRAELGYLYVGPSGAGHFVKMIHNGIEYGLMQAYAEGFEILKNKAAAHLDEDQRYDLNVADIAEVWRRGSVVSSWLLDLSAQALAADKALDEYSGKVADSGEGRWTIESAIEEEVATPVLTAALFARFRSRVNNTFGEKMLSAMRKAFGGHVEKSDK